MSSTELGLSKSPELINLRLSHHNASIRLLETCQLECSEPILNEIKNIQGIQECLLLKTCNRVEIIALGSISALEPLKRYWYSMSSESINEVKENLITETSTKALDHLLRLSSGLDSMVVGEEQILGQIQTAYEKAKEAHAAGKAMDLLLYKVLNTGRDIRQKTGISHGSVSIGSVAVKLLEETIGDIDNRNIGIIGAGEIAHLVGNHLTHKKRPNVYIANRTQERAQELATKLRGKTLTLGKVGEMLEYVEAVIVATSAPHPVINTEIAEQALKNKAVSEKLLIFDLSQPRNVEKDVGQLSGVILYNIDDLREISQKNLESRNEAALHAESLIQVEVPKIESILKRETIEPLISDIWNKADEVRRRELEKTFKLLNDLDESERRTVEKLSQVIVNKILHSPIDVLRNAVTREEFSVIFAAQKLFKLETGEVQD